jgi:hypothetical protein
MNKLRLAFRIVLFVSMMLMLALLTQAQAPRTWISGVGDDANACSRTTPCRTLAGAISKTMTGGEVDVLDSGAAGTVTITKSITIDGTGSLAAILAGSGDAIKINITDAHDTAKAVRLRGLSLNGLGTGTNGINIVAATNVTIEETIVDGFANESPSVTAQPLSVTRGFATTRTESLSVPARPPGWPTTHSLSTAPQSWVTHWILVTWLPLEIRREIRGRSDLCIRRPTVKGGRGSQRLYVVLDARPRLPSVA